MNWLNRAVISCAAIVFTQTSAAALFAKPSLPNLVTEPIRCSSGPKIFFINGVLTDEPDAAFSAYELGFYMSAYSSSCLSGLEYIHNPSNGLLVDVFLEAVPQLTAELGISVAEAIRRIGLTVAGEESDVPEARRGVYVNRLADLIRSITLTTAIGPALADGTRRTVNDFVNEKAVRVAQSLRSGVKTILVGHSQGNFYANAIATRVRATNSENLSRGLAVVNVANAAPRVIDGFSLTAIQDLVIGALAQTTAASTEYKNASLQAYGYDFFAHGFSEIYLNQVLPRGSAAGDSMAEAVIALVGSAIGFARDPIVSIIGTSGRNVFSINPDSLAVSGLGSFSLNGFVFSGADDMAINPSTGELYVISNSSGVYRADGNFRLSILPQSTVGGNALAFNLRGELYGMSVNRVFRVDITTGLASDVLSLGSFTPSGDLTFVSESVAYGTAVAADGNDYLFRVDVDRGSFAVVGSTGYSRVWGLYFRGGDLFGATGTGQLLSISQSNGAASSIGQLSVGVSGLQ